MPQVSILMPVYNGEKYLRESIDSVLNQTLQDFEFVIIDDGSTDATREIILSYHDSRIHFIENEKNMGLTRSLNKGLALLRGEYVARMDADDIYLPEKLEKQMAFMERHPEVYAVGTAWSIIDPEGKEISLCFTEEGGQFVHFMCNGSALIRKGCFKEVGGYREIFEYAQDYDLFLRIAEKFTIRNLKDVLYTLRIHDDSISVKKKEQQQLYASLALELVKERRKTGKDRLYTMSEHETLQFREQWLNVSGVKKRKLLASNHSTWSQAAYELDQLTRACHYSMRALNHYPFTYRAWDILVNASFKKFKQAPFEFIKTVFKYVLRRRWYAQTLKGAILLDIPGARKQYWNYRAKDIDQKWGKGKEDYAVLREIILRLTPYRILDIGCGSGRLFPLYEELHIQEVVGQDLAPEALQIAKQRYQSTNISITTTAIEHLHYPAHYFDLIISNRVLQHVPPEKIEGVIKKLTELGTNIYINEMTESDYTGEAFYLFKHDYCSMFDKYHFHVVQQGLLGQQSWRLLGEKSHENP